MPLCLYISNSLFRRLTEGYLDNILRRKVDKGSHRGAARRYAPRRWQFDGGISFRHQSGRLRQSMDSKIAADLRTSTDGSAVRTSLVPAVAKLPAASVPIDGQTDRQSDGSLIQNAPLGRGHTNICLKRHSLLL